MNHDDDGDHGNFRFHSHHELPRPNLIWFLKTYLLILVTHRTTQHTNIHILHTVKVDLNEGNASR